MSLPPDDRYDEMLRLAELFDASGAEMRTRARLGTSVLTDGDVAESGELSPKTWRAAEDEIRAATTGKNGLLTRSIELDADALVVRATVLTYRWIDELQEAAYKTLGSIAGRALGYLAPEVALGGAIVAAGLIETDALDRDGVAAYLSELAENNPELMDHVASGGGGLVESLQMRSLLTAGVLAGDSGAAAARAGLRAIGVEPFGADAGSALRDAASGFAGILINETSTEAAAPSPATPPATASGAVPASLGELMATLDEQVDSVSVVQVGPARFIAYLPGHRRPGSGDQARVRLVGGDPSSYTRQVARALERAAGNTDRVNVMLVGCGSGGVAAAEFAASIKDASVVVEQVVTANAPLSHVPRIPAETRVLSLEDRSDPVALLGSLINAEVTNRLTVVYDGASAVGDEGPHVAGGRAADLAAHPELRAEIRRMEELGYLAS